MIHHGSLEPTIRFMDCYELNLVRLAYYSTVLGSSQSPLIYLKKCHSKVIKDLTSLV
jgi:hypothetical protein